MSLIADLDERDVVPGARRGAPRGGAGASLPVMTCWRGWNESFVAQLLGYAVEPTDAAARRAVRTVPVRARVAAAIAFFEQELIALGRGRLARWAQEGPALRSSTSTTSTISSAGRPSALVRRLKRCSAWRRQFCRSFTGAASGCVDHDVCSHPRRRDGDSVAVTQGSIDRLSPAPTAPRRRQRLELPQTGASSDSVMAGGGLRAPSTRTSSTRVRRHGSTLQAATLPANLPVNVFDNLIETFQAHLTTWHQSSTCAATCSSRLPSGLSRSDGSAARRSS